MNQDDQDTMPADIRDLLEREAHHSMRMCLTPAELSGDWKAFEPIGGQDDPGDLGSEDNARLQ